MAREVNAERSVKNTVGSYHQWVHKRFVPGVSGIALEELTEKQEQKFYESFAYEVLSSNCIWCGHLILHWIIAEAGREGVLDVNPVSEFKLLYQAMQEKKTIRRRQIKRYMEETKKLGAAYL